MKGLLLVSAGLAIGGPIGASLGALAFVGFQMRRTRAAPTGTRPILMMLLVELRSGHSVLSALQSASDRFGDHRELNQATRVATVSGLESAMDAVSGEFRSLLLHLRRAQLSGSSAADVVRRMLESDLAREKALRLAKTRSLPVRLMIPTTLFVLPGVILLAYGPGLVTLLTDLVGPFG